MTGWRLDLGPTGRLLTLGYFLAIPISLTLISQRLFPGPSFSSSNEALEDCLIVRQDADSISCWPIKFSNRLNGILSCSQTLSRRRFSGDQYMRFRSLIEPFSVESMQVGIRALYCVLTHWRFGRTDSSSATFAKARAYITKTSSFGFYTNDPSGRPLAS